MSELRPAVFFDRDGTLIEDVGVLRDISGIRLFPDTLEALRDLREHFLFFIVSNQSAVSDGLLSIEEVERVNNALNTLFRADGTWFQDWYFCPHSESDRCSCRKPNHGFLL
jgi:histidinol-phosphate phosphatase family protein